MENDSKNKVFTFQSSKDRRIKIEAPSREEAIKSFKESFPNKSIIYCIEGEDEKEYIFKLLTECLTGHKDMRKSLSNFLDTLYPEDNFNKRAARTVLTLVTESNDFKRME